MHPTPRMIKVVKAIRVWVKNGEYVSPRSVLIGASAVLWILMIASIVRDLTEWFAV